MSSLNLVPNPQLMVAQAVVFFANLYVVKRLMVEPFLKLKEKREEKTTGSDVLAKNMMFECERKESEIEKKTASFFLENNENRKKIKDEARKKQQQLLSQSREENEQKIISYTKELRDSYEQEKKKIGSAVNSLSEEFYRIILS